MTPIGSHAWASTDPRVRVAGGVLLCAAVALAGCMTGATAGLLVACGVTLLARVSRRRVGQSLARLNLLFLVMAFMTVPFVPGEAVWRAGPVAVTTDGLLLMGLIIVKGNALVLLCMAFFGSMDTATMGHALSRLRVSRKFVGLLMSTFRYLDVLRDDYARMRMAMRARGFYPRSDWRTVRAHASGIGALLLRSLDRAERVADAIKCRGGGQGTYAAAYALTWRGADTCWLAVWSTAAAVIMWLGWIR